MGDRTRLKQVFWNLLANAIAYSPRDGVVTVSLAEAGRDVVLTVSDDGCGVDEGDAEQVFDRFFRGDNARLLRIPGAGLGLTIVRAVVEAHGGEVSFESAPDAGTTVRVVVPRTAATLARLRDQAVTLQVFTQAVRDRLPFEVPKVLGTAGQPSAVSSRPTSTSGLSPSPSTRKNFTITASASARPAGGVRITEEFDCSLEIRRTFVSSPPSAAKPSSWLNWSVPPPAVCCVFAARIRCTSSRVTAGSVRPSSVSPTSSW